MLRGMVLNTSNKQVNAVFRYIGIFFGLFLFAVAINVVIVPHALYSGTLTGVAQVIEQVILHNTNLTMPQGFNLTGIALMLLNIPLIFMVYRVTHYFPVKTVLGIIFATLALTFIPIPTAPLVSEPLTAAIVGGALAGFGAGFTLRCGGSGGGSDLIGIYCSIKYPNFTVGRVSLIIGAFVYTYGLIFQDLNTVVYSAIFTTVYALAVDQTFYQNIKTSAFVYTTNPEAVQGVMNELKRGATCWEGKGAFTGNHTHIFTTVVSKYEVPRLKRIVASVDPHAFIILNNKVDVSGNFEKRF